MDKSKRLLFYKLSLASLGILVILLTIKYLPFILELSLSLDKFRDYILSLGDLGAVVFIFFQILQIVIAPIPGEVIQIAGGYIYGLPLGMIYTTFGMLLGAFMAFFFTRFLGGSFIEKLIKNQKSQWITDIMDNNISSIILFIVFLIPGLPKDFLIYVAGLTPIKPLRFFGILLASRFPWLLASVSIGSNLHYGNYTLTIIISVIAVLLFALGLLYKDKLLSSLINKKEHMQFGRE